MTEDPNPSEKPKIIVDEGWKSQVEAEKEVIRKMREKEAAEKGENETVRGPLPPASLTFLASTLASQAMVAMGVVPNPLTNKTEDRPDEAKHFIDTLQVLYDKTQGNRTADETAVLDHLLHELRLAFVSVRSTPGKTD